MSKPKLTKVVELKKKKKKEKENEEKKKKENNNNNNIYTVQQICAIASNHVQERHF